MFNFVQGHLSGIAFKRRRKEGENSNPPSTICRAYGAGRHTFSMSRINPPKVGGGLKFESDDGIGEKGAFFKGLKMGGQVI